MRLNTGIYVITNEVNGKIYIGSAAAALNRRFNQHRYALRKGNHDNDYLQKSWNKYGERVFIFSVLERCLPNECLDREQYYIDFYNCVDRTVGYNIAITAGSSFGLKATDETKEKIGAKTRERFANKEFKEKHLQACITANQRITSDPEWLEKQKTMLQAKHKDPEFQWRRKRGCKLAAMAMNYSTRVSLAILKRKNKKRLEDV